MCSTAGGNEDARKALQVGALYGHRYDNLSLLSIGSPVGDNALQAVASQSGARYLGQVNDWRDPITYSKTAGVVSIASFLGGLGYGAAQGCAAGAIGGPQGCFFAGGAGAAVGAAVGGIPFVASYLGLKSYHPFEQYLAKPQTQTILFDWLKANPLAPFGAVNQHHGLQKYHRSSRALHHGVPTPRRTVMSQNDQSNLGLLLRVLRPGLEITEMLPSPLLSALNAAISEFCGSAGAIEHLAEVGGGSISRTLVAHHRRRALVRQDQPRRTRRAAGRRGRWGSRRLPPARRSVCRASSAMACATIRPIWCSNTCSCRRCSTARRRPAARSRSCTASAASGSAGRATTSSAARRNATPGKIAGRVFLRSKGWCRSLRWRGDKASGGRLLEDGERLAERLPALFASYRPAISLVHGDL